MKKLFLSILVICSLLGGNAYAKKILFSNNDVVVIKDRIFTYANDKIAKNYCNTKNKYFLRLSMNGLVSNKPADHVRYYCVNSRKDFISRIDTITDSFPSIYFNKSTTWSLKKEFINGSNVPGIVAGGNTYVYNFQEFVAKANIEQKQKKEEAQQEAIMFTIKDKRKQCEAIGFKPETEKFADCVLRLVELDVKKQQSNKIANAQNSGNEALVKQLQRQQYDRGTDALLNLGQQLLNPRTTNSNIYMPQTQRCTIQGFGSFSSVTCR
ncbi:hypothetical protein N8937_02345 [Candidatus Pelagibacter ubique]|nr:hypothetical protein [Candidatus Pelagibacter ubique]